MARIAARRWAFAAVLAVFVAGNGVLMLVTVPGAAETHGADASSWYRPAQALVMFGAMVHPDDPSRPDLYRAPGYPLVVAVTMVLAGDDYTGLLIPLQLAFLFATGLVAAGFTDRLLPGYGPWALALVTLNPNALGTAHLVQSETVYAFLVTCLTWGLFTYARGRHVLIGAAIGLFIGLAALTRPEGQFLAILVPIALLLLPMLDPAGLPWRGRAAAAAACLLAAAVCMTPWMVRNYSLGQGFGMTTYVTATNYLAGSAAQITMIEDGIGTTESTNRIRTRLEEVIASQGDGWQSLSQSEQGRRKVSALIRMILTAEPGAIATTVVEATIQFFAAGGTGNLHNLLGLSGESAFQFLVREKSSSYIAGWAAAMKSAGPGTVLATVVAIGFVIVLRLLGLAGLATLVRRREWQVLSLAVAGIAYFALVLPFFGNSRFRLGVEPLLILLALYGVDGLRRFRRTAAESASAGGARTP